MTAEPYSADNLDEFRRMCDFGTTQGPDGSVIMLEPEYRAWCRRWLRTVNARDAEIEMLREALRKAKHEALDREAEEASRG